MDSLKLSVPRVQSDVKMEMTPDGPEGRIVPAFDINELHLWMQNIVTCLKTIEVAIADLTSRIEALEP